MNDVYFVQIIDQANYIIDLRMQIHISKKDVDKNHQFEKIDVQSYEVQSSDWMIQLSLKTSI
jgi:hypothetical protein